jgi:hypothetical protein
MDDLALAAAYFPQSSLMLPAACYAAGDSGNTAFDVGRL